MSSNMLDLYPGKKGLEYARKEEYQSNRKCCKAEHIGGNHGNTKGWRYSQNEIWRRG